MFTGSRSKDSILLELFVENSKLESKTAIIAKH